MVRDLTVDIGQTWAWFWSGKDDMIRAVWREGIMHYYLKLKEGER